MAEATKKSNNERVYRMAFGSVYPLLVAKVERKGRTAQEVDEIITWLTGYGKKQIDEIVGNGTDYRTFFEKAPAWNPNAAKITGSICGYRVEEIEDELMRKVRYLDKLVDELAKGRAMEKILRK
jgi:hypothetical protein